MKVHLELFVEAQEGRRMEHVFKTRTVTSVRGRRAPKCQRHLEDVEWKANMDWKALIGDRVKLIMVHNAHKLRIYVMSLRVWQVDHVSHPGLPHACAHAVRLNGMGHSLLSNQNSNIR